MCFASLGLDGYSNGPKRRYNGSVLSVSARSYDHLPHNRKRAPRSMSISPRKVLSSQENIVAAPSQQKQPRPPRSAFICFTDAQKSKTAATGKDVLTWVAEQWRLLSPTDRAYWDEVARNDKVRFVQEKAEYKGPWNVPKRRAKKHPLAPKRPMSAFLKFSQKRRTQVKEQNPDMSNTDVSRLLGEMWRGASTAEKAPYVDQEQIERAKYKEDIRLFREEQAKKDAASRTSHHAVQREKPPPPREPQSMENSAPGNDNVDRRIFRSYSGGHPGENKPYKLDHQPMPPYRSSYFQHPTQGSHIAAPFSRMHLKPVGGQYEPPPQEEQTSAGNHNQPDKLPGKDQAGFRPSHHHRQPPPQQGENHHLPPLKNAGSDVSNSHFDSFFSTAQEGQGSTYGSFAEPEPPFNPRQQRPSSSHYFPENFYQYP